MRTFVGSRRRGEEEELAEKDAIFGEIKDEKMAEEAAIFFPFLLGGEKR